MLILERRVSESFTVHTPVGDVKVMVTAIQGGRVTLGVEAPKEWSIERDDINTKRASA